MRSRAPADEVLRSVALRRRWALHRHVHLLAAFDEARALGPISSFLSVGCGAGLSELFLASREPQIEFVLADYDPSRVDKARAYARRYGLTNVGFETIDLLSAPPAQHPTYDFVAAIEVLEHIEDDRTATANLLARAARFGYLLVPYAPRALQDDPTMKDRAWRRHEHYRVGYDAPQVRALLPVGFSPHLLRNCYFPEAIALRSELSDLSDDEVVERRWHYVRRAAGDVQDVLVDQGSGGAEGIEVLARRDADRR